VKPSPRVTPINRPFFDACNRNELMIQRCADPSCARFVYYPRVACPHCDGPLSWTPASGRARIVSYSRIHRPHHESFYAEAPYYFVAVQLDEGPIMYSRLAHDGPLDEGRLMGCAVRVVFVQHGPDQRLPFFKL
jgi:uncharacterized protein